MKFRTEYLSGNKVNLQQGGSGQAFEDGFGEKDRGEGKIDNNNGYGWGGEREGEGKGPSGKEGKDIFGGENEGSFASNQKPENPFEDTNFKGGEKKRSGFNIRIVSIDPPTDENGQMLRSQLIGGDIRLFRRHPDFEERVDASRKGEKRVSQRLITYIAGEITVHYKDKLQTKQGQPEYNKSLFVNFVEFIYTFESMIKHISGANLTRFSE